MKKICEDCPLLSRIDFANKDGVISLKEFGEAIIQGCMVRDAFIGKIEDIMHDIRVENNGLIFNEPIYLRLHKALESLPSFQLTKSAVQKEKPVNE